jgi:hypothetical protein
MDNSNVYLGQNQEHKIYILTRPERDKIIDNVKNARDLNDLQHIFINFLYRLPIKEES